MIAEAIQLAEKAHANQTRKFCGEAYSNHPLRVMGTIVKRVPHFPLYGIAAAVLHDVVEDTDYTIEDIYAYFGQDVARVVGELTTPKLPFTRKVRVEHELKRLATISYEAQTIKYADILDNTKDNPQLFYLIEKRRALTVMQSGYQALRGEAWLQVLREIDNARR